METRVAGSGSDRLSTGLIGWSGTGRDMGSICGTENFVQASTRLSNARHESEAAAGPAHLEREMQMKGANGTGAPSPKREMPTEEAKPLGRSSIANYKKGVSLTTYTTLDGCPHHAYWPCPTSCAPSRQNPPSFYKHSELW